MKLKGWKSILAFTFVQTVKSKSFKIATVVICVVSALLCAGINIIPALLVGNGILFEDGGNTSGDDTDADETEPVNVNTLYIYSERELGFELLPVEEVEYVNVLQDELHDRKDSVTLGDKPDMLLYIFEMDGDDLYLSFYRPEDDEVLPKEVAEGYAEQFTEAFTQALYLSIGVEEADLPLAQAGIYSYMAVSSGESWIQEIMNVAIPMGIALIFYMFIVIYSQQIAQSMAVEKSSRVIELLITSARPLAIITGKIAGTLLVSLAQIALVSAVSGLVLMLTSPFALVTAVGSGPELGGAVELITSTVEGAGDSGILVTDGTVDIGAELLNALPGLFNVGSIAAVIITLILGFLFFALMAGLVGASVSRIEDLATALQPFMLIGVVGFMLAYLPSSLNFEGDMDGVITFSRFFPLSSPFALPSAILMGQIGAVETVAAVVLLAIITVLAVLLIAKVYESMILYSGNRLKISQILKMLKKG